MNWVPYEDYILIFSPISLTKTNRILVFLPFDYWQLDYGIFQRNKT